MNGFSISKKQRQVLNLIEDPTVIELLIGGSAGGPLPLTNKVQTPFGYKTMGELKVGDQIFNAQGGISKVIDIPYEGIKPVYKITFSDGSRTYAADNHLWRYKVAREKKRKHLPEDSLATTLMLKEKLDRGKHILIPLCKPVQYTKVNKQEILDPYLLGVLLGDGCITRKLGFSSSDSEIVEEIEKRITGEVKYRSKYDYDLIGCKKEKNLLIKYGLFGKSSKDKFIPEIYKTLAVNERFELLQGLFDTDGTVDDRGHVSFTSISKRLAKDVQYIARSLGANATLTKGKAGYRLNGKYIRCNDVYSVYIQHEHKEKFFKLTRKLARIKPYNNGQGIPHKRIISIEYIRDEMVRCISTSALDGLFLTDDFIVTHNSKTYSICLAITILAKKYPGIKIFVGRKTLKSLRQSTISTLLGKVHPVLNIGDDDFHYSSQNQELLYKNGSMIIFGELDYVPSDPDFARIGSLEIDCAFIDEAGEITLEAKNAIKSRVGRGILTSVYGIPGFVVLSCNPSTNFLRQEYYDPFEKLGGGSFQKWEIGKMDIYGEERTVYRAFLRISAKDNPFLPQSYIDNLATLPDRERKRLLDGNWNYADDENSLFRSTLLDKAITFEIPKPLDGKFDKYIGVDVADHGKDKTIFSLIENGVLTNQKYCNVQMTWDENSELPLSRLMADELIEFAQRNGFTQRESRHIAVECNGVGVGIRDMLKERGWYLTEYTATHKSRSEGYYQLMLDMDAGEVKILNTINGLDELRKELSAHTYEMNNQTPDVVKKEKIKQAIGHSPDEADSFMIANHVRNMIKNPQNDPHRNVNRISF